MRRLARRSIVGVSLRIPAGAALLLAFGASMLDAAALAAPAPPWAAAPSTVVTQREMTFQSRGALLSGTLFEPADGKLSAIVVATHAASAPLRSAPLYQHLVQMMPPLGIGVFLYDRRGSGKSGGDLARSDLPMLADDAIAAVKRLKALPQLAAKPIGIWGLSQGGWLSLLAASRSRQIAFAVSISAPLVTPDLQMLFSSENSLRIYGYSQDDIDQMVRLRKAVDAYMRGSGDRGTAQALLASAKSKPWFQYLYMRPALQDRATARWRKEIEYDPLPVVKQIDVPALILYGTGDPVEPVARSVARLKPIQAQKPNLTLAVILGADHAMEIASDWKRQMDPSQSGTEKPNAPQYFGLLAAWLTQHGYARAL